MSLQFPATEKAHHVCPRRGGTQKPRNALSGLRSCPSFSCCVCTASFALMNLNHEQNWLSPVSLLENCQPWGVWELQNSSLPPLKYTDPPLVLYTRGRKWAACRLHRYTQTFCSSGHLKIFQVICKYFYLEDLT